MTRTLTKTETQDAITYTDGDIEIVVNKTGDGCLSVSLTVTNSGDPIHRDWQDYITEIEQENNIL